MVKLSKIITQSQEESLSPQISKISMNHNARELITQENQIQIMKLGLHLMEDTVIINAILDTSQHILEGNKTQSALMVRNLKDKFLRALANVQIWITNVMLASRDLKKEDVLNLMGLYQIIQSQYKENFLKTNKHNVTSLDTIL